MLVLFLLTACGGPTDATLGAWTLSLGDGGLTVRSGHGAVVEDLRFAFGSGLNQADMRFGAFRFEPDGATFTGAKLATLRDVETATLALHGDGGEELGALRFSLTEAGALRVQVDSAEDTFNRAQLSAACDADDHFLGLGGQAFDVDHVGEAFGVWVSEPGIGKVDSEVLPDDWYLRGTRHASSYPMPFALRPQRATGLLVDTAAKVDVDLCATDPSRFTMTTWSGSSAWVLLASDSPVGVLQQLSTITGRAPLAPPWVFAPWNDAIRGSDSVRAVADRLRGAGAVSSLIWSEDWKGAAQTAVGYQLTGEWTVDEGLYPDASDLAAELHARGFRWFAYFNPSVRTGFRVWDEAVAADVLVKDAAGAPYVFSGAGFTDEALLDLTSAAGRDFAKARMNAALDLGFDGWMADYGEWLPTDAVLADGSDPWETHNRWPELWQALNADVFAGRDGSYFTRSGWVHSAGTSPVVWAGDQSTTFLPDDGLPTVVALGLGLAASGVGVFTHDVAGYQNFNAGLSDKELWFRWASLGAFSPILRTHHGTEDLTNWRFDSDEETLAFWASLTQEHTKLWPYRYGLAARASTEGVPMLLPPAFRYGGEWGRADAWLLGDALLVAPVLERDARSRYVALPPDVRWYDWWTNEPVESGTFAVPLDHILVFAAAGTTVPAFAEAPDTLSPVDPPLRDLDDVDVARVVTLYGGGGLFTEADGTTYAPTGDATASGEQTVTLTSGDVQVGGVTLHIDGPKERAYTVRVVM